MKNKKAGNKKLAIMVAALSGVLLIVPVFLFAQVMSSTGYKIRSDSLNFGGGLSSSTSYIDQDTLGEVGSGMSSSTSYNLSAGYQAMQSTYLSITDSSDVSLPPIGGVSGGNSTGQSTWTVVTDDPAGYQLTVAATTSPALRSASSSIADYVPFGAVPDFNFTFGSASSTFGFSPEGVDIVQRYRNLSVSHTCGSGTSDTADACWDGFSTTPIAIAQSTAANHPNGATTTIKYQVGIGSSKIQDSGDYQASVVVTATAL